MMDMKFSCSYHKRKFYTKHLQVPSFTAAKHQLGKDLAQVLIEECPESLKKEMRLSDPLKGPGENLWISPSDLLIGKVVLTPPLTAKYIKALTHEGILTMGEQIEAQWLAAVELEKQQAMANLEELLMLLAERDKERAIEEALKNCEAQFQQHLAEVNAEFEQLLVSELAALETSLRDYYENLIDEQIKACQQREQDSVNEQINSAVTATTEMLSEKFMQDLARQEEELEAIFKARLDGQQERHLEALQNQEEVFTVVLKQLKHNLQCNNIASLMYVLCLERRNCMHTAQTIVNETAEKINELQEGNVSKEREIARLQCELRERQRKLTVREDCLLGVITQFQKFINFALKAKPTQAEFLLSVEKMMTLELTQALARTQAGRKPHLAPMLMPWRKISQDDDFNIPQGLATLPYHDCLNEASARKNCEDNDDLLAMTYKNRIYVREDFRNQITQGILPAPSSCLWSKDVQDLIKLIQDVNDSESSSSSSADSSGALTPVMSKTLTSPKPISSVFFLHPSLQQSDVENVGLLGTTDSVDLQKSHHSARISSNQIYSFNPSHLRIENTSVVNILGATDSISLTRVKQASVHHTKQLTSDEVELEIVQAPSDEMIKLKKESPRKRPSNTYSEVTLKLSKKPQSEPIKHPGFNSMELEKPARLKEKELRSSLHRKSSRCSKPLSTRPSAISQHVDSLELIGVHSTANIKKLRNIIMPIEEVDPEYPTQQVVIQTLPETRDFPHVNFKQVAEVFTELYKPEKPWIIYEHKESVLKAPAVVEAKPVNYLQQQSATKVLGNQAREEINSTKDFTIHRIHSIMDVLRKDDSLIRLFTKCNQ